MYKKTLCMILSSVLFLVASCGVTKLPLSDVPNNTPAINDDIVSTPTPTPVLQTPDSSLLTDYMMTYFAGNGAGEEQIYFALSHDGLNWEDLNNDDAVLQSRIGTQGMRDPFIMRTKDNRFVILATDLCIARDGDWWKCQWNGSKSIVIFESDDLINWSEPTLVKMFDKAGCIWAPEAVYNADKDNYMVFWASRVSTDDYAYQRIYYSETEDFKEFTEPQIWIDYEKDTIDTTLLKEGDYWYRFTKFEGTKKIIMERSTSLFGEWERISSTYLSNASGIEGPTAFALHSDDIYTINEVPYSWILYCDAYGGKGYYPLLISNLNEGTMKRSSNYKMPGTAARHGTVLNITEEEYNKLKQKKW